MKRITIIGGGASGTLVAANLLKALIGGLTEINLIEKRSRVGRGVAYSTEDNVHLLNVPAGRMGAFPDDVGHFHEWLRASGYEHGPDDFVPRRIFGKYLRHVLEMAQANAGVNVRLNIFEDDATDIELEGKKACVLLASGEYLYSEAVVLAFGNFLPPHPSVADMTFTSHPRYFRTPWTADVFDSIESDADVFIIGTGLSMVDVVLKLESRGHAGKITALSTRGLLPTVHKLGFTYPSFADELQDKTRITEILKTVRGHIRAAESDGSDWRAVIDCMRPATQMIWQQLPLNEKRLFMQHLSRYWDVARHRMPPQAAEVLDELLGTGQLEVVKGRIRSIDVDGRFIITFRSCGSEKQLSADTVINCIGSEPNYKKLDSRLIKNLFARGYIKSDPLDFGIEALPNGCVVGQNGEVANVIFTLGTALRGTLWETTAIPEIRAQAKQLAEVLLTGQPALCQTHT